MTEESKDTQINQNVQPNGAQEMLTHSRKKMLLFIVLAMSALCLIILFLLSLVKNPNPLPASVAFTDNLNAYSIAVPKDWVQTESDGENIIGENTDNQVTQKIEIEQLYVPGQYGLGIQVIQGKPTCPLPDINTTLAGFPAHYDSLANTWVIPTTVATLKVDMSYPGPGRMNNPFKQKTSASPEEIAKDKALLTQVLKTMVLHDLKPMTCK